MVVIGLNGSKMTAYSGTLVRQLIEESLLHSFLNQMVFLITYLRNGTRRSSLSQQSSIA